MRAQNTPEPQPVASAIPARLVALDREAIEALAQAHLDAAHGLLGLLDRVDGNPDTEDDDPPEDDDPAGQCDEDGINTGGWQSIETGPGCAMCDDGLADSDALAERMGGTRFPRYGLDQSKGPIMLEGPFDD